MAWYRNHYHCGDCGTDWQDEWSCCCDDECPNCGSRNWSPHASDNLTEIACENGGAFVVLRSPESAEHRPDYVSIAKFPSLYSATRYIVAGELI